MGLDSQITPDLARRAIFLRDVIRKLGGQEKIDTSGKSPASLHHRGNRFACRARGGPRIWSRRDRFPAILGISLNILIRAEPGERLTPEPVTRALSATAFPAMPEIFATIRADLDKAHMLNTDGRLTPIAEKYAMFWRQSLARQVSHQRLARATGYNVG
jgi:hypothetical protein